MAVTGGTKLGKSRSAYWKSQLRQWHWISSAICLAGLFLFAVTGVTLNHASSIEATPQTTTRDISLKLATRALLNQAKDGNPLPVALSAALEAETAVAIGKAVPELRDAELFIDLPGPGVDTSLTIDLASGTATYERTDRGWIAVLNDLHKGRDSGPIWAWFIDAIAIACVLFSLTGLGLLWIHAGKRPSTWPLTGIGFAIPVLLYAIFIHV